MVLTSNIHYCLQPGSASYPKRGLPHIWENTATFQIERICHRRRAIFRLTAAAKETENCQTLKTLYRSIAWAAFIEQVRTEARNIKHTSYETIFRYPNNAHCLHVQAFLWYRARLSSSLQYYHFHEHTKKWTCPALPCRRAVKKFNTIGHEQSHSRSRVICITNAKGYQHKRVSWRYISAHSKSKQFSQTT